MDDNGANREKAKQFTGRDVAEALAAARQEFGVSRRALGHEVVERPSLGDDLHSVVIKAWPLEAHEVRPEPVYDDAPRGRDRGGDRDRGRPRFDRDRGGRGGRGGGRDDRRGGGRFRDRDDRGPRRDREEDDTPFDMPALLLDQDVTDHGEVIEHLVESMITGMAIDVEVESVEKNELGMRVNLLGDDTHLLTERQGEGLEALQYIVNRILHNDARKIGRISLDADGWRAGAERKLIGKAQALVEEVKETGEEREFDLLGPYERRLVHVALADVEGIKTFSTGQGHKRSLHIAPADEDSDADES